MADPGTELAPTDPDQLVTEIERTRQELARTIDALADRVSPAKATRRALDRAREQAAQVDIRYVAAGAAVLVGATALFVWRRRRK